MLVEKINIAFRRREDKEHPLVSRIDSGRFQSPGYRNDGSHFQLCVICLRDRRHIFGLSLHESRVQSCVIDLRGHKRFGQSESLAVKTQSGPALLHIPVVLLGGEAQRRNHVISRTYRHN